jgi:MFS superfamily sulfate permease-like transporter
MNRVTVATFAERKALLTTRAELDRVNVTLAVHRIRMIVSPAPSPERMARFRPTVAMVIGFISPLLGTRRIGRWVRFISIALTAWRVARGWRDDVPH